MSKQKRRKVSIERLLKLFNKYDGNVYAVAKKVKRNYMGVRYRLIRAGALHGKIW